jgi:hypothetical protein
VPATVARSDDIEVRNPRRDQSITLSDFIVYGEDPNKQKKVIRAPDDPNDDTVIPGWGTRRFTTDFEIKKYIISSCSIDEGHYVEHETVVFKIEKIIPKKLAYIEIGPYIQEQLKVILEIDQSVAPEPPPEGTILAFVGGQNPQMPGWFVGTGINFDTGEVTGAYTGDVEVLSTAFEVLVFSPPYPPDCAVDIPLDTDLFWPISEGADSYDVYFGTTSPPRFIRNQTATTYDPGGLEVCRTYYWRIKPVEEEEEEEIIMESAITTNEGRIYDIMNMGDVWSFTTGPAKAMDPYPANGAIGVPTNVLLSWTPGCLATFHDVYFGTDFYAVANVDTSDTTGVYRGRQDANSYNPGGLELGTTYCWRIDGIMHLNGCAIVCKGDIWSFTMPAPEPVPPEEPEIPVEIPVDINEPPDELEPPPDEEPPEEPPIPPIEEIPEEPPTKEVPPIDRVLLTVWLWNVHFDDDTDCCGPGEMHWASWARLEGTPANEAQTETSEKMEGVHGGEEKGVSKIIFEKELNCDIPDLEIVIHFWDDDDDTAGKIAKIASALGDMTPDPAGKILTGLAKIISALNDGGAPKRDELGTLRDLDLFPPKPRPDTCVIDPSRIGTYEVKLNKGAGKLNGWIELAWKAPKIGTCTRTEGGQVDSISYLEVAQKSHHELQLEYLEVAQNSHRELQLEMHVYGEGLNTVMQAGDTRRFSFGFDTDYDRSTGCPEGTFQAMEWRVEIVQSSDGAKQDTTVNLLKWVNGGWTSMAIEPHDLFIGDSSVYVVIDPYLIGFPTKFSSLGALFRNGVEVGVGPIDPTEIHWLEWLPDTVSPFVLSYDAFPTEIGGPIEQITVRFSERLDPNTLDIQISPTVPISWFMEANTMFIVPERALEPAMYTVNIPGSMSDMAGNLLDGDYDDIGGDPFELQFLVPDRGFLPCDETGQYKNIFSSAEDIFVIVTGFPPNASFDVYLIVKDSESEGEALVDQTEIGLTAAQALPDGTLPVLNISRAVVIGDGEYSIVADMNGDGLYQAAVDRLWHPQGIGVVVSDFDVLDDFEDYYDAVGNRIFEAWIDGYGYADPPPGYPGNGTGSRVGLALDPNHGGTQSMKLDYDNTGTGAKAYYSQAERTFDFSQDWTAEGVEVLSLWFYGDPANAPEPMYVAVEDSMGTSAVVHHDNPDAAQIDAWTEWNINLQEFSGAGVNLESIGKMYVGVGDRAAPQAGGTGTLYFDDIRLCRPR